MAFVIAGLAIALVPFHQRKPGTVNGGLAANVPSYAVDCGVPLRTAFRRLDPEWRTSGPGAMGWYIPRPPDPACKTPARRRTLAGAAIGLVGLSLLLAMLTLWFAKSRRSRSETAINLDEPVAPTGPGEPHV